MATPKRIKYANTYVVWFEVDGTPVRLMTAEGQPKYEGSPAVQQYLRNEAKMRIHVIDSRQLTAKTYGRVDKLCFDYLDALQYEVPAQFADQSVYMVVQNVSGHTIVSI